MKIPLSWLQLTHEKIRFVVALAGISFADILMFMQLGFQEALFNSAVRLHKSLHGDIFIISSQTDSIAFPTSFSNRRLYEVLGVNGVKSVSPVYMDFASWKNPVQRNNRRIFVIGINPKDKIFDLPNVGENQDKLKQQDVILFDRLSRVDFGPIAQEFERGKTIVTEVSGRRIKVGELFSLGTSFGADGNILTSDVNFFRLFPSREKGLIEIGVIQLEPKVNIDLVFKKIRKKLSGGDVNVFDKEGLIKHEINYWYARTAIGFVFTLGTIMGFIVGTVIVYQILYTDVADHLPEYATLKALGYTDFYLLTVVFQEAIILACIGYIPGASLAMVLYFNAARATGLPIAMTVSKAITVLILTAVMCCIAGGISVGKLRSADPADIF